jgi:hypothetical protein
VDDDARVRVLFAVAIVVLTSVAVGAFVALAPVEPQPWLAGLLAALAFGAGILAVDWRRRR